MGSLTRTVIYGEVVCRARGNTKDTTLDGGASVTNLGFDMARFTQFPLMITRWAIIYEIISPGAAGSSIYV